MTNREIAERIVKEHFDRAWPDGPECDCDQDNYPCVYHIRCDAIDAITKALDAALLDGERVIFCDMPSGRYECPYKGGKLNGVTCSHQHVTAIIPAQKVTT